MFDDDLIGWDLDDVLEGYDVDFAADGNAVASTGEPRDPFLDGYVRERIDGVERARCVCRGRRMIAFGAPCTCAVPEVEA